MAYDNGLSIEEFAQRLKHLERQAVLSYFVGYERDLRTGERCSERRSCDELR